MSGVAPESKRHRVLDDVKAVLKTHLAIDDVDETTHLFEDLQLDSVQQLTFVVELENHFEICFDEGDEEFPTDGLQLLRIPGMTDEQVEAELEAAREGSAGT